MAMPVLQVGPTKVLEEIPGANIADLARTNSNYNPIDDYAWLDTVDSDNCFMPLDHKAPTKSLDFGCDGVTGSVTAWHELLQATAPDQACGLVFTRGDFPDNPDAILARAQRRNQRGGFGLEVQIEGESPYVLERTAAQGLINGRWPYTRFNFVPSKSTQGQSSEAFAHQSNCSFVKDHTLYQILRITPAKLLSQSRPVSETSSTIGETKPTWSVKIQVGGMLRMGCPNTCSATRRAATNPSASSSRSVPGTELTPTGLPKPFYDSYTATDPDDGVLHPALTLDSKTHQRRLEIRVWVDQEALLLHSENLSEARRKRLETVSNDTEYPHEAKQLYTSHRLTLTDDKPVNVVATFRFTTIDHPVQDNVTLLAAEVIQDYLGVADVSKIGVKSVRPSFSPYRLWSMVLAEGPRPDGSNSFHLNAIGRCVEEVIDVLAVPVPATETNVLSSEGATPPGEIRSLALVQNIVASQQVDLASTMWHIRLLIKARNVLLANQNPSDVSDNDQVRALFSSMRSQYLTMLESHITAALVWVLDIFPSLVAGNTGLPNGLIPVNGASSSQVSRRCREADVGDAADEDGVLQRARVSATTTARLRTYGRYCSVIAWYVVRNAKFVLDSNDIKARLGKFLRETEKPQASNEDNQGNTVAVEDALGCVLRWFHSHSVIHLYKALLVTNKDDHIAYHKKWANHWGAKAGKAVRLFGQGRFARQAIGHEVANLVALSIDIGAKDKPWVVGQAGCLDYVKDLVTTRRFTTKVEAGAANVQRWDAAHTVPSAMPRPAPWELSCLGHYLPVTLDAAQPPEDSQCLEACKMFLLADHTFIPSWDFSKVAVVGLWWDLTTSSIICSRLLFEKLQELELAKKLQELELAKRTASAKLAPPQQGQEDTESVTGPDASSGQAASATQRDAIVANQKRMIKILEQINGNKLTEDAEGFTWSKRRPQLFYHADTSVQSLEDTPQVYQLKQTHDVRVRPNIRKMMMEAKLTPPNWTLADIPKTLPAEQLSHISVIDFNLGGTTKDPKILLSTVSGEVARAAIRVESADASIRSDLASLAELMKSKPKLWEVYCLDIERDNTAGLPDREKQLVESACRRWRGNLDNDQDRLVKDKVLRQKFLGLYQESLFRIMNDSLVDLGTKYRIIFSKRIPPTVLQTAVHMWHPDAVDTFDDYLGTLSHFSDNNMCGQSEPWLTDITLSHWRPHTAAEGAFRLLEHARSKREAQAREPEYTAWLQAHPAADETDPLSLPSAMTIDQFPPSSVNDERNLSDVDGSNTNTSTKPPHATAAAAAEPFATISEECISLVITGDGMGRCWTCTLICDLIDDAMLAAYARDVRCILQMFIHQQYAGRALVFAFLLGQICKSLAIECERYMEELDRIMGLAPMQLLQGLKWDTSDVVLQKLKGMLWSLEALRIFDLKLEKAIEKIKEAKDSLEMSLSWGKDLRPLEMRKERDRVWEEFNKRFGRLINAHNAINQRINQGNRLREGMGSVVGIEQNENISMLTWMTIIYLPLSFITAVFSMGNGIIPTSMDGGVYGGLMVAGLLLTWIFSLWLQSIIQNMRHVNSRTQARWARVRKDVQSFHDNWNDKIKGRAGGEDGTGGTGTSGTEATGGDGPWSLTHRVSGGKERRREDGMV